MLRIIKTLFLVALAILGFPGLLDDAETWAGWIKAIFGPEWQWWNYLLLLVGVGGLIWTWWPEMVKMVIHNKPGPENQPGPTTMTDKVKVHLKGWWQYEILGRHQVEYEDGSTHQHENTWIEKAGNLWKWTFLILLIYPAIAVSAIASILGLVSLWVFGIYQLINIIVTL